MMDFNDAALLYIIAATTEALVERRLQSREAWHMLDQLRWYAENTGVRRFATGRPNG